MKLLESIQKRLTKTVKGREKLPGSLGLLELGEEKAEGRPHLSLQLKKSSRGEGADLLSLVTGHEEME